MFDRLRRGLDALVPRAGEPPRIAAGEEASRLHAALDSFRLRDPGRFSKLFLRSKTVPVRDDDAEWLDLAERVGLVRRGPLGVAVPAVRLFSWDGALVATDLLTHDAEDQVFSLMLEQAYLVARMDVRPGDHVLEICVGSGVNALFASDRAARVVGIDVSDRALAFAAFNTALNPGACPVELRKGSLSEPLGPDERFDVILVNPPFEPMPPDAAKVLHSSAGEDGLDLVRTLLPGVPQRLRPGGRFDIVTWSPASGPREVVLGRLLAETFPGRRVELHVVQEATLDRRIDRFRDVPGYAEWRERLVASGCTHVPLVWARVHPEAGGLEVTGPAPDLDALRALVHEWTVGDGAD